MKNLRTWMLLLAFVLVLGGAGLLYGKLAPQMETEQLGSDQPKTPGGAPGFYGL